MNSVHRFFTEADWAALRDTSLSLDAKTDVMVDRRWKVGGAPAHRNRSRRGHLLFYLQSGFLPICSQASQRRTRSRG